MPPSGDSPLGGTPGAPLVVVGIGASTDEPAALEALLRNLPALPGLAVVVVQVGSAPGLAARQLGELTALPVQEVVAGLPLQADNVYAAPTSTAVGISGGTFFLDGQPRGPGSRLVIDSFLRSLAAELRGRAIAVTLSGCEPDGVLGLQTVKGEGGITIGQDSSAAQLDGSLHGAGAADAVDLFLRPEQIGQELGRIAHRLVELVTPNLGQSQRTADDHVLAKIYGLLRKVTGVDFSFYKQTTLRRRLARRLIVRRVESLQQYLRHLQSSPSELKELYEDMLINVTRFFRDPETLAELRTDLLPLLLRNRTADQPIRIWVPGCASGEEVYSLAILILEHPGALPFETPIQIFGTDISERSIEKARAAIYPESVVTDVSPERLRRFFIKVEDGYQVVKRLRDLCVFARQNLASDPPFSRLDLISCRNVLIYLGPTLQKTIIATFHYALKSTGFLLLGSSETIRDDSNLFTLLDKRHKFYAKNPASVRTALELGARPLPRSLSEPLGYQSSSGQEQWNEMELQRAADRIILARLGPAGVIINERAEILQSRGHTKLYLQSLLEERDIANQELISANEKIQSSNEELQSINEELETAKEELQSTNEELQTVNEELYSRNLELGQTSNDLLNLLNNIPVLMLDSELRIRQFTPIAERVLQREKERLEGRVLVTEQALDRTQDELRALAVSLFTAQEEERRRVSRELHDDLAQKLALLDLNTTRLQQGLTELSPAARGQLDELRRQIGDLSLDLRRIAYQLHPTILDDLGIGFALKELCAEFSQREGFPVQYGGDTRISVSQIIGGSLYRITQEALRNVAKHAGRTAVQVQLRAIRDKLSLKIRDQGNGFEPGEARGRGGLGILNMEERARLIGGSFTLKAQPGKGVAISVRVPLSQDRAR